MSDQLIQPEDIYPLASRLNYCSSDHWNRVSTVTGGVDSTCKSALLNSMLESNRELEDKVILDIATGDGRLAVAAATRKAWVVAIDISDVALEQAKDYARRSQMSHRVSFDPMDVFQMPYNDNSFDLAMCLRSFWVFPHSMRCLEEIYRVLKPGGSFLVQIWGNPQNCQLITVGSAILGRHIPDLRIPKGVTGPFDYTPARLEKELQSTGFLGFTASLYSIVIPVTSVNDYWDQFKDLAGTAYWALIQQPKSIRAIIDSKWKAASQAFLDPQGSVSLSLEWFVCSAHKPNAE